MPLPWAHHHHHQPSSERTAQDSAQKELMGFQEAKPGRVLIRLVSSYLFCKVCVVGPHSQAGRTSELSLHREPRPEGTAEMRGTVGALHTFIYLL